MVKYFNIPIFVPHAGCPHDCVFCNQNKITGMDTPMDIKALDNMVQKHLDTILSKPGEKKIEIAFFGGSFTGIPTEQQFEYLTLAKKYKQAGLIDGIRLSTRPDYINQTIVDYLKFYGVTTIELGVQSMDTKVLSLSNRGHSSEIVFEVAKLIKENNFQLGLQMMIGLPGDTFEKSIRTAKRILSCEPDFVRIYPTIVIKETVLETLHKQNMYQPLSLKEAVDWTAALYTLFKKNEISVIRMGLQPSEAFKASSYVAGPYHPAFRQLVESTLYKNHLEALLAPYDKIQKLTIYISTNSLSHLVGQKRENLSYFETKYQLKRIKILSKEMAVNSFECHLLVGDHEVILETTI